MNKELKSQDISNPFTTYSISLKIGGSNLSPTQVTKESLLEEVNIHNDKMHLDFLPDFLNIEMLDVDKALSFYEVLMSLDDSIYKKMAHKVLYFNNQEFHLSPAAPSNLESFSENQITFDIASNANDLVFLSANFEKLNPLANERLLEVEQFIIEKNQAIATIENDVVEAENNSKYEKLSDLYTQLRELKYARFSAFKIFKLNVDLMQDVEDKADFKLENLELLLDEYLVPPIH
jgi:hypothetical protein